MQTATSALQTVQTSVPGSPEQKQAQATLTKSETGIAGFADKYPKSAAANQLAGRSLVKLGDYDRAAPIAERSVSLAERKGDPKAMTQALLLRGDVRFGRKDYAGALKDAQSALKLDPKNKGALALRAQAAGRTGTESAAAPPRAPDGAGMSPAGATAPGAAPARASGAALSATGEPARPAAVVMTAEGARKADALTR
ncbi:MAG: tetratricopeptide repeat protein, partial [Elusimicrobia bacterium]|nr:tetratricopeptide repeat protein [Elusimicrobiota bacterium]